MGTTWPYLHVSWQRFSDGTGRHCWNPRWHGHTFMCLPHQPGIHVQQVYYNIITYYWNSLDITFSHNHVSECRQASTTTMLSHAGSLSARLPSWVSSWITLWIPPAAVSVLSTWDSPATTGSSRNHHRFNHSVTAPWVHWHFLSGPEILHCVKGDERKIS